MSLSSPHLTMKKNVSSPSSFTALESAFVDSEWTPVDVPCPSFHSSTIVYSERDKRFYVNNCNPDYTGPTDFTPTSNPGLLTPVAAFDWSEEIRASTEPIHLTTLSSLLHVYLNGDTKGDRYSPISRRARLTTLSSLSSHHSFGPIYSLTQTSPPISIKKIKEPMGLDYSYTQLSMSEDYYGDYSADSGHNQTEANIQLDQAEIDAARRHYPPQPEVEFGFLKECYCGGEPLIATSHTRNDPGRRYYTCANVEDGDCHVWKWWDVAATEEIRAISTQCSQLCDKVDYLAFLSDYEMHLNQVKLLHHETEQRLVRLERIGKGFELVVGVLIVMLVIICVVLMFK